MIISIYLIALMIFVGASLQKISYLLAWRKDIRNFISKSIWILLGCLLLLIYIKTKMI